MVKCVKTKKAKLLGFNFPKYGCNLSPKTWLSRGKDYMDVKKDERACYTPSLWKGKDRKKHMVIVDELDRITGERKFFVRGRGNFWFEVPSNDYHKYCKLSKKQSGGKSFRKTIKKNKTKKQKKRYK